MPIRLRSRSWRSVFRLAALAVCAVVITCFAALPKSAASNGGKSNGPAAAETFEIIPAAEAMVLESLVPTKALSNVAVLKAMMRTNRALFVPKEWREAAFFDIRLPIGEGRITPRPFFIASMLSQIDPQPTDRVLEIGTGGGYETALLAQLTREVYTVESVSTLSRRTAETFKKLRIKNVHFKIGDERLGWPDEAPFDKIIVAGAAEEIPPTLLDQLSEGGTLVIPLGNAYQQRIVRCVKKGETLEQTPLLALRLDPLPTKSPPKSPSKKSGRDDADGAASGAADDNPVRAAEDEGAEREDSGEEEAKREAAERSLFPVDGFESPRDDATPEGWYAVRNALVKKDMTAPEGMSCLVFDNTSPYQKQRRKAALERIERRKKSLSDTAKAGESTGADALSDTASDPASNAAVEEREIEPSPEEARLRRQRLSELTSEAVRDFPVDGRKIRRLDVTCRMEGANLKPLGGRREVAAMTLEFFDEQRASLGEIVIFSLKPSETAWREKSAREVPVPRKAREATLRAGLLNGIGILKIDQLEIKKR